jgi:hypothetical protein
MKYFLASQLLVPMSTALARLETVSVRMRDLAMVGIGIAIIPRSFVSFDRTRRDFRCYSRSPW